MVQNKCAIQGSSELWTGMYSYPYYKKEQILCSADDLQPFVGKHKNILRSRKLSTYESIESNKEIYR
jgi:hypothetical protein